MLRTSQVGNAFWNNRKATGNSVRSTGDKLYSYFTVLLQRLPDGKVIGNITKYSSSTSKHQSQCQVRFADLLVDNIPHGTNDLSAYLGEPANIGKLKIKRRK